MGEKVMEGLCHRDVALRDYFMAWEPRQTSEIISLDAAMGRILAQDCYSRNTLPVVRSSSYDGIAVQSETFVTGIPDTSNWRLGVDYIRADTGDDFDDRFDAVIMIEKAAIQEDGSVVLDDDVKVYSGAGVNQSGSTIREGDLLMRASLPIRPTDLSVLAMGGIEMVPVIKRPRVAFIPTGSELVPHGVKPKRGQNVDTNSLMVKHLLIEMGAEPMIFPIIPDDPDALTEAFDQAFIAADIVVINGGSASGDEDFNYRLITDRGTVIHHYIAAAPGRPMMLAVVDEKPVINLPGPAAAAYYGSDWCLRAVIARWLGIPLAERQTIEGIVTEEISGPKPIDFLNRMDVTGNQDGSFTVTPRSFSKGEMAAYLASNAQYISRIGVAGIPAGSKVTVELLRGMEYIRQL
jgi:molybdopterin molybdotransferase